MAEAFDLNQGSDLPSALLVSMTYKDRWSSDGVASSVLYAARG
jgi:hypothetical protein